MENLRKDLVWWQWQEISGIEKEIGMLLTKKRRLIKLTKSSIGELIEECGIIIDKNDVKPIIEYITTNIPRKLWKFKLGWIIVRPENVVRICNMGNVPTPKWFFEKYEKFLNKE